jgi:hypothetical protein
MKPKDFKDSWAGEPSKFNVLPPSEEAATAKMQMFRSIWAVPEGPEDEIYFEALYTVRSTREPEEALIENDHRRMKAKHSVATPNLEVYFVEAAWLTESEVLNMLKHT